jgi:hypothetical protein
MKTQQDTLNLDQLAEQYEIIGELAGRNDVRTFIARRRSDGADVHIAVAKAPQGDEGNALSHLAADVQLLAAESHPNLLTVLDGQWVGTDAFAFVQQRPEAPSLDELLTRRDEEFPFPRIAAVLQTVNRVLEWARAHKVVHRGVGLDTLFLEPGSDRVMVAFVVGALPRAVMPGVESDAKTIALLARAMLTRSAADPERANRPLAELRPGLPASVVQQTNALLGLSRTSTTVPDVTSYISAIAMADALKEGEIELEKARHAIEEQQRKHREQLERERREHDQQLAEARAAHQREAEEQGKRFQAERADLEAKLARERKALEKERQALAKERAAHARDCETLAREREAHEREVAAIREKLEWESAALSTQAERYAKKAELETDLVLPKFEPKPVSQRPKPVPVQPAPRKVASPVVPAGPSVWERARARLPEVHWNRRWTAPATVGLVLVAGLVGVAVVGQRQGLATRPATRVTDSVAGNVVAPLETLRAAPAAPPASAVPLPASPAVPPDLVSGVAGRTDSVAPERERASEEPSREARSYQPEPIAIEPPSIPQREPEPVNTQPRAYQPPSEAVSRGAGQTITIDGMRVKVDSVRRGGVTYRPGQGGYPRR